VAVLSSPKRSSGPIRTEFAADTGRREVTYIVSPRYFGRRQTARNTTFPGARQMKPNWTVLGLATPAIVVACSAGSATSLGSAGAPNSGSRSASTVSATGAGGTLNTNPAGTGGSVVLNSYSFASTTSTVDAGPGRAKVCDDAGNCVCLRLALIGTLDSAANANDTTAFTGWLNSSSQGTATVTTYTTQPTLDDTFLSGYDILLIANVDGWTFSAADKQAVANWVTSTGGGIMTLTGFTSVATEPADTSQLISFAGMGYTSVETATPEGQNINEDAGVTAFPKYCIAWGSSSDAIITTPIALTPETGSLAALTFDVSYIGAFMGWGVDTPPGSTVVATDPVSNEPMLVADVVGSGKILSWGDEWITLENQWVSTGTPPNTQLDQYNQCYHMVNDAGLSDPNNYYYSVQNYYQTKQFWYDAITWVAPPSQCTFTITDPSVTPIILR
jgi:hypothetical protein